MTPAIQLLDRQVNRLCSQQWTALHPVSHQCTENYLKLNLQTEQRLYFLKQLRKFNQPQELQEQVITFCTTIIHSPFAPTSPSGLDLPPDIPNTDFNGQLGLRKGYLRPIFHLSTTCTCPEQGNGQVTLPETAHTLDTDSSNSSPLVGVAERCTPKQFLSPGCCFAEHFLCTCLPFYLTFVLQSNSLFGMHKLAKKAASHSVSVEAYRCPHTLFIMT